MDRIDPADPMDRIDPALPMDRIDPADPTERIDPAEPVERTLFLLAAIVPEPTTGARAGPVTGHRVVP